MSPAFRSVSTQELIGLYHLATALIFPSEHNSWSIPVMEAMACGCPVASSNVTSLPICEHARADWPVSPCNGLDIPQRAQILEHPRDGSDGLRMPGRKLQCHQPSDL